MPSKYELASDETVPVARSIIAKALIGKYNLTESEAAKRLGVAQAAVSKYVTGKYSDNIRGKIKSMEAKMQDQKELIDVYMKKISEGREEYVNACICTMCNVANGFNCAFSHAYSKRIAASGGT